VCIFVLLEGKATRPPEAVEAFGLLQDATSSVADRGTSAWRRFPAIDYRERADLS